LVKNINHLNTYPETESHRREIQFRALNGEDPLRQFSNTWSTELESMQSNCDVQNFTARMPYLLFEANL